MTDISNKDSEQDVKIAVIDSTLENATRRMELIHKRIDRTDEKFHKLIVFSMLLQISAKIFTQFSKLHYNPDNS